MRVFQSAQSVHPTVQHATKFDLALSGNDRRIAKSKATVEWLTRAYAEMQHESRYWPFDRRSLKQFLDTVGVDTVTAAKNHEDAIPIPEHLVDVALCIDSLKGASFLNGPAPDICLMLNKRAQVTPRRR